jgi:hypothetical protein
LREKPCLGSLQEIYATGSLLNGVRFTRLGAASAAKGSTQVVVANGLEELTVNKHTVEDHLVKASNSFLNKGDDLANHGSESVWESLGNDDQEEVLRKLCSDRGFAETVFP